MQAGHTPYPAVNSRHNLRRAIFKTPAWKHDFFDLLQQRVVIFDGAVGTNLQLLNLTLDDFQGQEGCNEILVRSRPDVVRTLHASFYEVGCDVVETNTFGASAVVLAEFDLAEDDVALNREAAQLAKAVAAEYATRDHPRFVAGSMGPGTKLPSLGHISFAHLHTAYSRQAAGLLEGGVDLFIVETCQDLLQTKAALIAIFDEMKRTGRRVPVIAQVTIETTGAMLLGSDMQAAYTSLSALPIDVLGMNCATGPKTMGPHLRTLAGLTDLPLSVLPNAGMPRNVNGQMVYDLTPEELAGDLSQFVEDIGINIVGGCCGTAPVHLQAVVNAVKGLQPGPRAVLQEPSASCLYSTAAYNVEPKPLIIGERTNTNGSKKFREYLLADDLDGMLDMTRTQIAEQIHLLDVSVAYVGRDEQKDMGRFAFRLNTECTVPVMIDSTELGAIETALTHLAGKCVVNSINLEDGPERAVQVLQLCRRYGAGVVALTIDEQGMAQTADEKMVVARRLHKLVQAEGLATSDIFFDMLTFTLGSGAEEYRKAAVETFDAIRRIKQEFPEVHTVLGVSNCSFGLKPRLRHRLNSVFLHHAIEAGLDAAILHAGKIMPLFKIADEERQVIEDLLFDRRRAGYDPLTALLELDGARTDWEVDTEAAAKLPVAERLKQRIINGNRKGLEEDIEAALAEYDALHIVNEVLLAGMATVGELFGSGEMQLPFVLQSAETMKASVGYLEPHMEHGDATGKGKMILATVKGDVHDIGKNLVDIILSNNGFDVVNLGIKQPLEAMIDAFEREGAHAIGMSGLLVKSTIVMRENLITLAERNLTPPVILGGAALNRRYVEDDLQPIYPGRVYYAGDAFDGLALMNKIMSADAGQPVAKPAPAGRRVASAKAKVQTVAVPMIDPPGAPFWGSRVVSGLPLDELTPFINRTALFRGQWGIKKKGKNDPAYDRMRVEQLEPRLEAMIVDARRTGIIEPKLVYGYFPCNSEGDRLYVYRQPDDTEPAATFHFPRQTKGKGRCISDFFLPLSGGRRDVLAAHIVTVGERASAETKRLYQANEYADYLYFHGFAVEMAEALAEYWHREIRRELGISDGDGPDIPSLFRQKYRGSRYSFGYPACPNLEDQQQLFHLLEPERIGLRLTENFEMVPEQSTSAIIVHHPEAKYFTI